MEEIGGFNQICLGLGFVMAISAIIGFMWIVVLGVVISIPIVLAILIPLLFVTLILVIIGAIVWALKGIGNELVR